MDQFIDRYFYFKYRMLNFQIPYQNYRLMIKFFRPIVNLPKNIIQRK